MFYRSLGRLMLLVHGPTKPTDVEWNAYLRALEQIGVDHPSGSGLLVIPESSPTSAQRDQLRRFTPVSLSTAVVSGSLIDRGIVTMLGWVAPIRAFAPADIDSAFQYLSVSPAEKVDALHNLALLRLQLCGIGIPDDAAAEALMQQVGLEPLLAARLPIAELRADVTRRRRTVAA